MKYLYIRLEVRDGEREHIHHCLHTTNAKSIEFAAERYAASFWGGESTHDKDGNWIAWDGEIMIKLEKVQKIAKNQYNFLNSLFY